MTFVKREADSFERTIKRLDSHVDEQWLFN